MTSLYLQTALADVFQPVALEGEDGYRAAARVRLLLTQSAEPIIAPPSPIPWEDSDVIWLTGLHEAQGHRYFNKEAHEQVLWWRHLPQLVAIAEKDPAAKLVGTRDGHSRYGASKCRCRRGCASCRLSTRPSAGAGAITEDA